MTDEARTAYNAYMREYNRTHKAERKLSNAKYYQKRKRKPLSNIDIPSPSPGEQEYM